MPDGGKLEEILRLTKENNQMLRAMRRNARVHTIFKMLVYAVMATGIVWGYLNFVAPMLSSISDNVNKIQSASTQAQTQMSGFSQTIDKIRSFIPGMASSSTH